MSRERSKQTFERERYCFDDQFNVPLAFLEGKVPKIKGDLPSDATCCRHVVGPRTIIMSTSRFLRASTTSGLF
jgi:hypothetical protein